MRIRFNPQNKFTLAAFEENVSILKKNEDTLDHLVLQSVSLGEKGYDLLIECLSQYGSNLSTINLDGCQLKAERFNEILQALIEHCPKLVSASFLNCSFDFSNINPMLDLIKKTNIRHLNIDISYTRALLDQRLTQSFYEAILQSSLRTLHCRNRLEFSPDQKIKIENKLEQNKINSDTFLVPGGRPITPYYSSDTSNSAPPPSPSNALADPDHVTFRKYPSVGRRPL